MRHIFSRLLILLSLAACAFSVDAQENDSTQRAMKALQRAAMSYPMVRTYKKNAENQFYRLIPLDKTDLVYFSPLAAIIDRRISTTKFKNLVWKQDDLVIDPDLTYAYTENLWLFSINMKYTF